MNLTFTGLLYGAAAACLAVSFRKDREKTNQAVKKGFRMFLGVLPHFLTILLITGILFTAVTPGMIRDVIGTGSGFRGMVLSALTGAVALVPVLAVVPMVSRLLESGAGIPQMAVFISTLTTVGIATLPLEIRYLGVKASILRNLFFFVSAFITSWALGVILA